MDLTNRTLDKMRTTYENLRNYAAPRNLEIRNSNYPFLGSDTYFELCNLAITSRNDFKKLENYPITFEMKIFIVASLIPEFLQLISFDSLTINSRAQFVLITEADNVFETQDLVALLEIADHVYASNLLGKHDKIKRIPLGLEKQSFRSAGRRRDFYTKKLPNKQRKFNFLVAWNDETNSNRSSHRKAFLPVKNSLVINNRISPRTLHKLMLKTLFVPSPAGNGLDCHRTWEALYLGCVPIVLKQDYCGDETWPVLVVEDWAEVISKTQEDLLALYYNRRMEIEQSIAWSVKLLENIR